MSQKSLLNASLWGLFLQIDADLVSQTIDRGCSCGGPLYRADYVRKPRGPSPSNDPLFAVRFSSCCGAEGCRKRATPPSVRFLGRKVFLGVIVVLVSALRQGPTPARMATLEAEFGVGRRTVQRWQRWWREIFVQSRCWKLIRARLVGVGDAIPGDVVDHVRGWEGGEALQRVMHLFAPFGQSRGLSDHVW